MKYCVFEVLDFFTEAKTREEKIKVLRKHGLPDVKAVLRGTFHPKIEYCVKETPKYKPMNKLIKAGMAGNTISNEVSQIYLFEPGNPKRPKNLTDKRMNQLLTQILESLEDREATVFMNMLLKDLKVPGLDADIVKEAFPGLLD